MPRKRLVAPLSAALGTATIGILGWERSNRVVETWNEACHLTDDI